MIARQYETHLHFPTFVWKTNVKEELFEKNVTVENLIDECFEIEQTDKGRKISNEGENAYQSSDWYFLAEENKNLKLHYLMKVVDNVVQSIYRNIWQGNIFLANSWININRKGAFNSLHHHAGSVLSGCIYLKTPKDCGCLRLEKDFAQKFIFQGFGSIKEEHSSSLMFSDSIEYTVNEADLFVFPAHIPHRVKPNSSEEARISIAFNYGFPTY